VTEFEFAEMKTESSETRTFVYSWIFVEAWPCDIAEGAWPCDTADEV
jgi:hypothetical protein